MRHNVVALAAIVATAAVLITLIVAGSRPVTAADAPAPAAKDLHVIGGQPPVMLDSATGKTWVLVTSQNIKRYVWVPVKRLDTDADIEKWQITGSVRDPSLEKGRSGD